jgi:hypothetical protein
MVIALRQVAQRLTTGGLPGRHHSLESRINHCIAIHRKRISGSDYSGRGAGATIVPTIQIENSQRFVIRSDEPRSTRMRRRIADRYCDYTMVSD